MACKYKLWNPNVPGVVCTVINIYFAFNLFAGRILFYFYEWFIVLAWGEITIDAQFYVSHR